jgi:hypothetical protein
MPTGKIANNVPSVEEEMPAVVIPKMLKNKFDEKSAGFNSSFSSYVENRA